MHVRYIPTQCVPSSHSGTIVAATSTAAPDLRTNIMDFRGFDSSISLVIRGGIIMSLGDVPESLSQAILVGIMLLGRLGVL